MLKIFKHDLQSELNHSPRFLEQKTSEKESKG